jgi:hypothetical protein
LIDWSILSALLIKERIPERMEWKQELLLNESRLPHPVFVSPKTIPSQVNYKRAGNLVVGLVCGGVVLFPQQTYDKFASPPRDSTLEDNRSKVTESPRVDTHHWWWDAGK